MGRSAQQAEIEALYADLSYDQIAAALGVQPGTVAASLSAAHASLRRSLEEVAR